VRKPIVLVVAAVVLVGAIFVGLGTLVGHARQTRMAAVNRAEGSDDERGTERRWVRRDPDPAPAVAAPSEAGPAPVEPAPAAEEAEAPPLPQAAQPAASAARPVLRPPIRRAQPPLSPAERAMTQTETVLSSVRGSGAVELEEGVVREDKRALEALPGSLSSALRDSITFSKVECYERGCVMQIGYPNMEAYRRANADFFTDTRSEFNSWRGLRQRTPPIVGPDGKVQSSWILLREE
jgi:hypothetical protein